MSGMELNDVLLSLPIFSCRKCEKFINPPIMLVVGIGNVCGSCIATDAPNTAVHNSGLEMILQHLRIPCRNGCAEKLDYFNMNLHEAVCVNRKHFCPMRHFNECSWEGTLNDLVGHSMSEHSDIVLRGSNNSFLLDVDITKSYNIIKLLHNDNNKFILHINCDLEQSQLRYIMYYIGKLEKIEEFSYSVEQSCDNTCSLYHGTNSKIYHDSQYSREFDLSKALSINISLLKQFVNESTVVTLIRIFTPKASNGLLEERILNYFECPICNSLMKPPIYLCLTGHSICNRCRPRLHQCPSCRSNFGNARNYALEALTNTVSYPCGYRELGCLTVLPLNKITKHESDCHLKPYNCPLMETYRCAWEGTLVSLSTHLNSDHKDKVRPGYYYKTTNTFSFDCNYAEIYCMFAYGEVFRVCHKRDMGNQNTYWSVQLIGPSGESKKYKCEIGMIDGRNENRKLIRTDLCQDLSNQENMFNQCIMVPTNVLSWFAYNGHITYYCKITKLCSIET